MTHVRTQIREAAATTLTGLTTTGTSVFKSRVYPLQPADLPALIVATGSEDLALANIGAAPSQLREVDLIISGIARGGTDVDLEMDQIAAEVETALTRASFSGLVKSCELRNLEPEMSGEGDAEHGVIEMTFAVQYVTPINAPETAL